MKIKIKRLHPSAVIPKYATDGSAAFDITAVRKSGNIYDTGLAFELPKGHALFIYSRSGHAFKDDIRLANCVAVIDHDYRGEVKIKLAYDGNGFRNSPQAGERIAQGVILKLPKIEFEEVDELTNTDRGEDGFGSTGN